MNPSSIYLTISIVAVAAVVAVLLLGAGIENNEELTPSPVLRSRSSSRASFSAKAE